MTPSPNGRSASSSPFVRSDDDGCRNSNAAVRRHHQHRQPYQHHDHFHPGLHDATRSSEQARKTSFQDECTRQSVLFDQQKNLSPFRTATSCAQDRRQAALNPAAETQKGTTPTSLVDDNRTRDFMPSMFTTTQSMVPATATATAVAALPHHEGAHSHSVAERDTSAPKGAEPTTATQTANAAGGSHAHAHSREDCFDEHGDVVALDAEAASTCRGRYISLFDVPGNLALPDASEMDGIDLLEAISFEPGDADRGIDSHGFAPYPSAVSKDHAISKCATLPPRSAIEKVDSLPAVVAPGALASRDALPNAARGKTLRSIRNIRLRASQSSLTPATNGKVADGDGDDAASAVKDDRNAKATPVNARKTTVTMTGDSSSQGLPPPEASGGNGMVFSFYPVETVDGAASLPIDVATDISEPGVLQLDDLLPLSMGELGQEQFSFPEARRFHDDPLRHEENPVAPDALVINSQSQSPAVALYEKYRQDYHGDCVPIHVTQLPPSVRTYRDTLQANGSAHAAVAASASPTAIREIGGHVTANRGAAGRIDAATRQANEIAISNAFANTPASMRTTVAIDCGEGDAVCHRGDAQHGQPNHPRMLVPAGSRFHPQNHVAPPLPSSGCHNAASHEQGPEAHATRDPFCGLKNGATLMDAMNVAASTNRRTTAGLDLDDPNSASMSASDGPFDRAVLEEHGHSGVGNIPHHLSACVGHSDMAAGGQRKRRSDSVLEVAQTVPDSNLLSTPRQPSASRLKRCKSDVDVAIDSRSDAARSWVLPHVTALSTDCRMGTSTSDTGNTILQLTDCHGRGQWQRVQNPGCSSAFLGSPFDRTHDSFRTMVTPSPAAPSRRAPLDWSDGGHAAHSGGMDTTARELFSHENHNAFDGANTDVNAFAWPQSFHPVQGNKVDSGNGGNGPVSFSISVPAAAVAGFNDGGSDDDDDNDGTDDGSSSEEEGVVVKKKRVRQEEWMHMFRQLKEVAELHGNGRLPAHWNSVHNPRLQAWMQSQRYKRKRNRQSYPQEHLEALESVGFTWSLRDQAWNEKCEKLEKHFRQHGAGAPVNRTENPSLSMWVKTQRKNLRLFQKKKQSSMTLERATRLHRIGFRSNPERCRIKQAKRPSRRKTAASGCAVSAASDGRPRFGAGNGAAGKQASLLQQQPNRAAVSGPASAEDVRGSRHSGGSSGSDATSSTGSSCSGNDDSTAVPCLPLAASSSLSSVASSR